MSSGPKDQIIARWTGEWETMARKVTDALLNRKNLADLGLPKTDNGFIDLRGYSAPKDIRTVKTKMLTGKSYVSESIRIKKNEFEKTDLSLTDFELCKFDDCHFRDCLFDKARWREIVFAGCSFEGINFRQTDLGRSGFGDNRLFFTNRKNDFSKVTFDRCNLSDVHFIKQGFLDCRIDNCKTGMLLFSKCRFQQLRFSGTVRNLFITSCRVSAVDLSAAFVSGISLNDQRLEGFVFPAGDTYYMFSNKKAELAGLEAANLNTKEKELLEILKTIWGRNNAAADFVDINFLEPEEIPTGISLLQRLKEKSGN